jgi:putative colanic acid biosynthesis glycosyltransferase WcaI
MQLLVHDYAGHPFQIQLSRELAGRGNSVLHAFAGGLLTPRGRLERLSSDEAVMEITEIPVDPKYRRDKYRFLRRRRMEIEYGWRIEELIQNRRPDVVISANTPTEPQLSIAGTCSRLGIHFVPWIQDFYSIAVAKLARRKLPLFGACVGWWYQHLEKQMLRVAASVVAITEDFAPILRNYGVPAERIKVIPNWAPLDELPLRPRRNAWSAAHDLDDKFVFLYSGTLAMKHNPDLLWQLALAFEDDENVRVVIVTEGPGGEYLLGKAESRKQKVESGKQKGGGLRSEKLKAENRKQKSEGCLRVLPFQAFSDMPDVLASADVLVAVLEADAGVFSVPSKVLTYHCAGRPILAAIPFSNLAARTIVQAGSGVCVEPGDFSGFLEAARRFQTDASLRERCGKAGRAYAEKNFDIEAIADRFEEAIGIQKLKH